MRSESKQKSEKVVLLVYGTLKRGDCRNGVLSGSKFLGTARTVDDYTLYSCYGAFPAMVRETHEDDPGVQGELYEVEESLLDHPLDGIEGVPDLYDRHEVTLKTSDDQPIEKAWCYLYQQPVAGKEHLGSRWKVRGGR